MHLGLIVKLFSFFLFWGGGGGGVGVEWGGGGVRGLNK